MILELEYLLQTEEERGRLKQKIEVLPSEKQVLSTCLHFRGIHHSCIDIKRRHQHFTVFSSFVQLEQIPSPPRAAALFCLARMFPRQWRQLFRSAFPQDYLCPTIVQQIDEFNSSFRAASISEFIEIADIHMKHQQLTTEVESNAVVEAAIPMARRLYNKKEKKARRAATLFAVATSKLNVSHREAIIGYLKFLEYRFFREIDQFAAVWKSAPPVSDEFIVDVYRQFGLVKLAQY